MDFSKNTRTIVAIASVLALVLVIYSIPLLLKAAEPQICTINGECQHELFAEQLISAMPIVLLAGIALGAGAYYLFSERNRKIPAQINHEGIYKLLDPDERKLLAKIVEGKGRALQSELSYIEGIGKVKAHRIIERMEKKGIVEKESFGKTNAVKLPKDLQELFL